MCKHTKCCFNRKHHSPWGIPDYLGFLPGCRHKLGKVRSVILTPNTWHCQTSCNHEMRWRGLPRRNAGDGNTLPRFCLPVSSRLSRSTRRSPSQQPRVELGGDLAIQVWHALETHHCTLSHASLWCKQYKPTLLWQQLVSFIQIQCNWLHPGGTPGSNILIKLICEILTMWVFSWLRSGITPLDATKSCTLDL